MIELQIIKRSHNIKTIISKGWRNEWLPRPVRVDGKKGYFIISHKERRIAPTFCAADILFNRASTLAVGLWRWWHINFLCLHKERRIEPTFFAPVRLFNRLPTLVTRVSGDHSLNILKNYYTILHNEWKLSPTTLDPDIEVCLSWLLEVEVNTEKLYKLTQCKMCCQRYKPLTDYSNFCQCCLLECEVIIAELYRFTRWKTWLPGILCNRPSMVGTAMWDCYC